MSKFDDFIESVVSGSRQLAQSTVSEFIDLAEGDTKAFLNEMEDNLRTWTSQLTEIGDDGKPKLSKEDFLYLVEAQKELAKIEALTRAGIAATTLERFRNGLINLISDSAFKIFL